MKANIVSIKRFAVHDGDGIRTTVFFKGCPLRCLWCHNPEAISTQKELAFYKHKCQRCGCCSSICTNHIISDDCHKINRAECKLCGRCAEICPNDALTLYGEEVEVSEICRILLLDRIFYEESGGGVTLSGGECLLQHRACLEILSVMKDQGIRTAVDTCGFVTTDIIDTILPYTDAFLYDIKAIDDSMHIRCTGQSNRLILENLRHIDLAGIPIEIRIPYVPGYNDTQIPDIADFLCTLNHLTKVRILPYHDYARSKYQALQIKDTLPRVLPTDEEIRAAIHFLHAAGLPCTE